MADLARLSGGNFIVVGRVGMDFYPDPPGTRTAEATQFFACMGGSAANTAAGLVRHGCAADLVTCVSDDAIGRFALNELDRYGVGRAHVRPVGGEARTSLAVVESRIKDHQSVIYRNGAADFEMTEEDVAAVPFDRYAGLITAGTVFAAEPSRTAAFLAQERAREAGLPVIFDIDYRPYSWPSPEVASDVLSRAGALADIIVGNDVEFGFMAGGRDKGLDMARDLVREGASIVVYKMGELGAITITEAGETRSGIYKVEALKPTGAGDAFMGGFVAALAGGLPVREAVLRGSASAAIVVARVGCAPAMPTAEELDRFIDEHPGPTVP